VYYFFFDISRSITAKLQPLEEPAPVATQTPEVFCQQVETSVKRKLPFFKFRIATALFLLVLTLVLPYWVASFFWGIYMTMIAFLFVFVSNPVKNPIGKMTADLLDDITKTINRRKTPKAPIAYKVGLVFAQ
jgi:hypothetical protein